MAELKKIVSVVGTRPNLMKAAPVIASLQRSPGLFSHTLVHTGQHYDPQMSSIFFEELAIPKPEHLLEVGSGTHAQQTAKVMQRLEPVLLEVDPDLVLVYGDVNSTLAAAITADKLGIPVAHVEAGLRSFDRTMPEETNRLLTDAVSTLLFTTSPEAETNLVSEGHKTDKIHFVGNTMIDTLAAMMERIETLQVATNYGLEPNSYVAVTLHRPALVDSAMLADALVGLTALSKELPVVFPVHPRTKKAIKASVSDLGDQIQLVEPLGYLEFLSLVSQSRAVLTDSGGIQEETTYLGVPCFTLRDNTERPITVELGTNMLLGLRPERIAEIPELLKEFDDRKARIPPLWDGQAAGRIIEGLRTTS